MRFIRWFVFLVTASVLAWFAAMNWTMVTINLVSPYQVIMPLPLAIFIALALGALPPALSHAIDRWRWKRRVKRAEAEAQERALELAEIKGERERMLQPEVAEAALMARVAAAGAAYADDDSEHARAADKRSGA